VRGASDKWALVLIPSVGGRLRKEKEIRGLIYKTFLSRAGDTRLHVVVRDWLGLKTFSVYNLWYQKLSLCKKWYQNAILVQDVVPKVYQNAILVQDVVPNVFGLQRVLLFVPSRQKSADPFALVVGPGYHTTTYG
jgi:hypothetical protein